MYDAESHTDLEVDGYQCFGNCEKTFDTLDEMVFVAGQGDKSGRHFCTECARSLRYTPEEAYNKTSGANPESKY